jgi:Carboxypeptidase regulatory-like domain
LERYKNTVKKLNTAFIASALLLLTATPAICSSIVGLVVDQNRQFINGAIVTVLDSSGHTAGTGRSDLYGRFCIPLVKPGKYTVSIDPPKGFQGGTAVANVDIEGSTINWFLSPNAAALATTDIGVASAATVTCAAPWWTTAAAGAAALVGAGGLIGGVIGSTSGGGGGSASPSE